MSKNTRKSPPEPKPAQSSGFNNPFAGLAGLKASLPGTKPQVSVEDFPTEPPADGPARAVVRLARRERDGTEVTRVEELGLTPEVLEAWGQALQRGLACRCSVDGDALVLEGDQRRGVPDLLLRRGVKRVSQG